MGVGTYDGFTTLNASASDNGLPSTILLPGALSPPAPPALYLTPSPLLENGNMATPRPVAASLASLYAGAPSDDAPPLPPPHYALPPPTAYHGPEAFRHRYGDPDDIVERHEDLQDSRENLMGFRFRMQAKRKRVRMVREQTGEKEGHLIRQLRQFLYQRQIDVPPAVRDAWDLVDASRDELGLLEAEYDEEEEKYHGQEIKYTTDEAKFVDNLLKAGSTRNLGVDHERKISPLTNQAIDERYSHSPFRLAETRAQIDDWLLEFTSASTFQRYRLRARHEPNDMNDDDWWKLVKQTWNSNSSTATQLQNGNSTFSQGPGSQPLSAADLVIVGPENMDLKDPVPRDLLPEEPILDAPEDPSFAPTIESGDLCEPGDVPPLIEHEQKSNDTTHSVSTDPSNARGTISSDELSSNSTMEQVCSCLNCPTCQGYSVHSDNQTRHSTFIDRQVALLASRQRQSPLSTLRQDIKDSETPNEPSTPVPQPDNPQPTTATSDPPISDWPIELVDDYELGEHDPVSTTEGPTPRLKPRETSASPYPGFDTSKSSVVEHASAADFRGTPSVRMNQPGTSSQPLLPILPLTPHALAAGLVSTNILNLPFVNISNYALRLPGPISDDLYM